MTDMFERFEPAQLDAYIARTEKDLAHRAPLPGLTWEESEPLLAELIAACRAAARRRADRIAEAEFETRLGIGVEILSSGSDRIGITAAQGVLSSLTTGSPRGLEVYRETLNRWAQNRRAFAVYCRARRADGTTEQQIRWVIAPTARAAREQVDEDGPTVYGVLEPVAAGAPDTDRIVIVDNAVAYFVLDNWTDEPARTIANAAAELDQLTHDLFGAAADH